MRIYKRILGVIKKCRRDAHLRLRLSLVLSLTAGAIYCAFQIAVGSFLKSEWHLMFTLYYIFISFARAYLLVKTDKRPCGRESELRECRRVGITLLFLNFVLLWAGFFILTDDIAGERSRLVSIIMGVYSGCSLIMSLLSATRYRKHQRPLFSAAKILRVNSALVSFILFLNVFLLGKGNGERYREALVIFVSLSQALIIMSAIYMIVSSKERRKREGKG